MSAPTDGTESTVYTARQSRVLAVLLSLLGVGAGVAVAVMVRDGAPRPLIVVIAIVAVVFVVGGVQMFVAPRTELVVDAHGVRVDGRPPIPWAWVRGVAVEPDDEGDDRVVLYVDDAWWQGVSGAWARWGAKLYDDDGNRGFVPPSSSLRSRVEEMADAIDDGLRRFGQPTWPDAEPAAAEPADAFDG